MKRLIVLALVVCAAALRADSPALTITQQQIPSPASIGATRPLFVPTSGGQQLIWLESTAGNTPRYVGSKWEIASSRWSAVHEAVAPPPQETAPEVHFPDGTALSVSLPEKDGQILDLHAQHWLKEFSRPRYSLSSESWPRGSTPSPSEPPLLRAYDNRAIAVWLNHAEKSPRLFAALSINAGEQFLLPVRIDDGRPYGRASLVFLRDRSAYITWLEFHGQENSGALWMRRLSPAGEMSVPVLITTAPSVDALGHPQLAVLKDYDTTPAQLLLAHELTNAGTTQIVTRLISLPSLESFTEGRPCLTCPPDSLTLPGYPLAGRVIRYDSEKNTVEFLHSGIPGILPAGKTQFQVDEKTVLTRGGRFVVRVEKRNDVWHLFSSQPLPDRRLR